MEDCGWDRRDFLFIVYHFVLLGFLIFLIKSFVNKIITTCIVQRVSWVFISEPQTGQECWEVLLDVYGKLIFIEQLLGAKSFQFHLLV